MTRRYSILLAASLLGAGAIVATRGVTVPPNSVPPPEPQREHTPIGQAAIASAFRALESHAREERYLEARGSLEAGGAGLHLARPSREYILRYAPESTLARQPSATRYEFLDLTDFSAGPTLSPPSTPPIPVLESELGEHSVSSQVSMSRIIGNEDLVATAVPAPGGVGYTIECSFTPRGIATFTELVGPTVMPRAGYDWCRFWLQAGQAVTQCDAVLVADNECLGSFSVRDLLTAGATVTTLEPRKFLSKGEAIAIAGRLNL